MRSATRRTATRAAEEAARHIRSLLAYLERVQIHVLDDRDHEPREVIGGQPVVHARRQQEHLTAIAPQKVLRHAPMRLTPPDGTAEALCNSLHAMR
jgi:hypothetical protein